MSQRKSHAAKTKNHQWRRHEFFDEQWFSRFGHRPNDSLYEKFDALAPQAPQPWSRLPVLPLAAIGGNPLLESKVHALVGAMAAFTPSPFGLTAPPLWNGPAFMPIVAVDPATYASWSR